MKSAGLAILFLVVLNTTVFAQSDCTEHKSLVLPVAAWAMELATTATSDQAKAAQGNNAFAIELYRQLRKQSGNLFFSPESISTALAMTYAGARADTAAEMAKTLHFTLPQRQLHPAVGALLRDRNTAHDGYQLKEADALWVQTGYSLLPEFLKLTKDNYEAGLNQVDFQGATEASRQTINLWVEQRTENKIRELLRPRTLNSDTRLVLTNAIYFKGDWEEQFKKEDTKNEDFRLSAGRAIKTPLMRDRGALGVGGIAYSCQYAAIAGSVAACSDSRCDHAEIQDGSSIRA